VRVGEHHRRVVRSTLLHGSYGNHEIKSGRTPLRLIPNCLQ
jgi:hypothetical protein